jgi:four helix bundle protein
MAIYSYQELHVWQKAMELAVETYQLTKQFPREEQWGLISQLRRAAVSVVSNIAEGWGRNHKNEFKYFLRLARGSAREMESQLILSQRIGYVSQEQLNEILSTLRIVSKQLFALEKSCETNSG